MKPFAIFVIALVAVLAAAGPLYAMDRPPSSRPGHGTGQPGGTPASVPEPASMLLLGGGAAAIAFARRRRGR